MIRVEVILERDGDWTRETWPDDINDIDLACDECGERVEPELMWIHYELGYEGLFVCGKCKEAIKKYLPAYKVKWRLGV